MNRFTFTARGPQGRLGVVIVSPDWAEQRSLNELAEARLSQLYHVSGWTLVHCYRHDAPTGLHQTPNPAHPAATRPIPTT